MEKKLRILIVEDLPSDAELIKQEIKKNDIPYIEHIVETEEGYLKAIRDFDPDLILSDYSLPSFDGMQALLIKKELAPSIPFILVTGSLNEETAVEVMKAGADDYILKDNLTRLGQSLKSAIETKEIIRSKKETDDKLRILSRAVEQNPASIVITNLNGEIEYVNPKFTKITGYTLDEVIGKNPRLLKSGSTPRKEYKNLWETITSGNEWHGEFQNLKKDGTIYFESASISPIADEKGIITHFLAVKEDITEKKQMVNDLIAAKEKAEESDRLKSAFLANMSHELRTPLNSIIGFSELMTDPDYDTAQQLKFARMINISGNNLFAIISDIMDISKIEAGQIQITKCMFSVNQLINGIMNEFTFKAIEKGIDLRINTSNPEEKIMIESDEKKLRQILHNLLNNAIKFTNKGYIEIGFKTVGDFIQLHIKDTGIGISKEFHEQIFVRFHQIESALSRKYGGNGLGLAISKSLVELLGGAIWLESELGKGSTFYLLIPISEKQDGLTADLISNIKESIR